MPSPVAANIRPLRTAPNRSVLVVGHDDLIRKRVADVLSDAGYRTTWETSGESGLAAAAKSRPGLVVLSSFLPDLQPRELLPRLAGLVPGAASLVVADVAEERDLIAMLDAGADECWALTEGTDLLLARVRAVLRRTSSSAASSMPYIRLGELYIDTVGRTAQLNDRPLQLTPREFDLLTYLAQRRGQVISRRELLTEVWRLPSSAADKTIDVHVSWLRRKLHECAQQPRYLQTVRGVGLRLDFPAEAA